MKKLVLFATLLISTATPGSTKFEQLYDSLYLGQAYPSGHLYLVSFNHSNDNQVQLPERLHFYRAIRSQASVLTDGDAIYSASLAPAQGEMSIEEYIPGLEGMWDSHDCGTERHYKRHPEYRYVRRSDFFDLASGGCYEFGKIGRYTFKPESSFSYPILASDTVRLENIRYFDEKILRPLSRQDREEHNKELEQYKQYEQAGDCYTVNRTLADAEMLMEADIQDSPNRLRLSFYPDPGCMGHYVIRYIIDVMDKEDKVLERREIMAVQGVL